MSPWDSPTDRALGSILNFKFLNEKAHSINDNTLSSKRLRNGREALLQSAA